MTYPNEPFRFAVLSHHRYLNDFIRESVDTRDNSLRFELVDFETGVPMARACLHAGSEVIICHGGTGNAIMLALGDSVVTIDRTDMDVIKTLEEARHVSRDIVFAAYDGEEHDLAEMEKLLGVHIHLATYDSYPTMRREIRRVCEQGLRVLIGGGVSSRCMEEFGGIGFVIKPNPRSIRQAFGRARAIARQKRLERVHLEDLAAIFRQLREGVVCLDEVGQVVASNALAHSMLKLTDKTPEDALMAFSGMLHLDAVLKDREPRHDMLVHIAGEPFVVTTLPITMHGGRNGAVALFQDVPTIQKISRKIGEELYAKGFVARTGIEDLRGNSRAMCALKEKIRKFAVTDATVLIYGETGTGKELVAHALHCESRRRDKPFVAANFAALSSGLLESELFGYEDGAFTGARRGGKMGLFEMAHKGTLFLDEVGELGRDLQIRLLRVLENHEVMRVGGNRFIPVDVRIVCASHRLLPELVAEGTFRLDLYYRLSTLKLDVPPLRDRTEDFFLILRPLLEQYGRDERVLSPAILRQMKSHPWRGNIRELLAVVETYCILLDGRGADEALFASILMENMPVRMGHDGRCLDYHPEMDLKANLDAARARYINEALHLSRGDKKRAAQRLGISPSTLWRSTSRQENVQEVLHGSATSRHA